MKKLTKKDKRVLTQLLVGTRTRLQRLHPQNPRGICAMMLDTMCNKMIDVNVDHLVAQHRYLKTWISRSLGEETAYLSDWLEERGYLNRFDVPSDYAVCLKLKNTRIAWVEWMIEQLKKK